MSITFYAAGAPCRNVVEPCCYCDEDGRILYTNIADDESVTYEDDACPYCGGTGVQCELRSELPEINMANGNAYAILGAIGIGEVDYCGCWNKAQLDRVQVKLMTLLNLKPESLTKEAYRDGNFYEGGRTFDYVTSRLQQMLSLVVQARAGGYEVTWA